VTFPSREIVRRIVESSTPVGLGLKLVRRGVWMVRLATSGIFDVDYYRAQRGKDLSRIASIWDFLTAGPDSPLSFHPLVDGAWIESHTRRPGRTWYATLFAPGAAATSTSPVFDVHRVAPGTRLSSARVLRRYLQSAGPDAELPVAERTAAGTTLAEGMAVAWASAEEAALQTFRNRSRESSSWDRGAARRYVRGVRGALAPGVVESPTVTIVMPARDRADTVQAAVRSVIDQTYPHWILAVIDDGSTDGTADRVRAFHDPRIRVLSTGGVGVSAARNLGIGSADTTYLAFLDADNEWTSEFLEGCLGGLIDADADYAYSAIRREETRGVHYLGGSSDYEQLRDGANAIDLNALIARRDIILELGGFDESLRRWVDYDLELRLSRDYRGVYCPFVGVIYDHRASRYDRITNVESQCWRDVVLAPHLADWTCAAQERIPGRLSVVIVSQGDPDLTLGTVRNLLEAGTPEDIEIVVVTAGESASIARALRLCFAAAPVTVVRLGRNHGYALQANIGLIRTTGEYVVLVNHVAKVERGWATRIRAALGRSNVLGVQPLLRAADGTIESAGTVFFGSDRVPAPFLQGLPLDDARRAGEQQRRAISGLFLATRAEPVLKARGMDPHFVASLADADLCLRLAAANEGTFEVLLDDVVKIQDASAMNVAPFIRDRALALERWADTDLPDETDAYRAAGFSVAPAIRAPALDFGPPALARIDDGSWRWSIKVAAPAATRGDDWGDRFFGDDLASALSDLGIRAAVDRREAAQRSTAVLDDVAVFVRGTVPVEPIAGLINILWIISHPDEVTIDEVKAFDVVYAASAPWAEWMSAQSGREVRVLLQATNRDLFTAGADPRSGCVFVGSTRGQQRPIVAAAAEAGLAVRIFGRGWESTGLKQSVAGRGLGRDDVATEYRRADIVLNDHWPDMARWGFISNRVFDAVACGARVVSDAVHGLDGLFGEAVVEIEDPTVLGERLATIPPATTRMRRAWSEAVRTHHSFGKRAEELVESAEALRLRS
jgi:GT2 family glycosyltransferase